jgi:hypothetical protein
MHNGLIREVVIHVFRTKAQKPGFELTKPSTGQENEYRHAGIPAYT